MLRMDQAGMKSLPLGKINLHKLSNMNPDAKGHLEKIMTANQDIVHTVCGLVHFATAHAQSSLPMVCWFAGDKCMDTVDIDTMDVKRC